jgi:hypothetical protein
LAEREAKALGTALFISEFGGPTSADSGYLTTELIEEEQHRVGFAFWNWKENGDGGWGMYAGAKPTATSAPSSGCLRASRERLLARVYPQAASDPLLTYHYDPATSGFELSAEGRSGDAPTLVYIPPEVAGTVTTAGAVATAISANPDGSRVVTSSPTGGSFSISVAAAPLNLTSCA